MFQRHDGIDSDALEKIAYGSSKVEIKKTRKSLRMIYQEWPKQKWYCLN